VIDLSRDGSVWVLRLTTGENRFSLDLLAAIEDALDEVAGSDGPCALVTTGDGKFYSNGLDLDWLLTAGEQGAGYMPAVYRLIGRVMSFPAITVAAVNGHAFGAGALLATAHDFAVMRADRGYWCMPEADLGLPLSPQLISVLTAKLPRRTVQEAVLTGRRDRAPDGRRRSGAGGGGEAGCRAGREGPGDARRAQAPAVRRGDQAAARLTDYSIRDLSGTRSGRGSSARGRRTGRGGCRPGSAGTGPAAVAPPSSAGEPGPWCRGPRR